MMDDLDSIGSSWARSREDRGFVYEPPEKMENGLNQKYKLDKKWFYESLKRFTNKYVPIFFDIPLSRDCLRYRIVFSWSSIKPNGDYNPYMSCQLIDTTKYGSRKYVVPDLLFDCVKEGVTTDYKLYKYLSAWIDDALKNYKDGETE